MRDMQQQIPSGKAKKNRPTAATVERLSEIQNANKKICVSADKSNTKRKKAQSRKNTVGVAAYLLEGKGNAIPGVILAKYVGCKSVRDLQKRIERERQRGVAILATAQHGGGYYLPAHDREVTEFVRTLRRRARNTALTAEAINTGYKERNGQIELEGF